MIIFLHFANYFQLFTMPSIIGWPLLGMILNSLLYYMYVAGVIVLHNVDCFIAVYQLQINVN